MTEIDEGLQSSNMEKGDVEKLWKKLSRDNANQVKQIEESLTKQIGKEIQNKFVVVCEKSEALENRFVHFEEQI